MYVCVHVYLYLRMCTFITVYLSVRMCTCVPVCTYMYMYTCMYVCMCTCIPVCTYVYMYTCMYVCVHVYLYVCMYVCMCTCIPVCTYVYMYTCMYVCMYVCVHVYLYVQYGSQKSSPFFETRYRATVILRSVFISVPFDNFPCFYCCVSILKVRRKERLKNGVKTVQRNVFFPLPFFLTIIYTSLLVPR